MGDFNSFEGQLSDTSLIPDTSFIIEESVIVKNKISTPKSEKKQTEVKRWASVVKCQKPNVYSPDSSTKSCKKLTYKLADTVTGNDSSDEFLEDYENHKGFLAISLCKTYIACKICSEELNSIPNLTNHLKTRKHEDNIIQFLKSHIPPHLHHTMEFISFSGSNLCCNLCKIEVEMSSENPQETILNIIAHNTDIVHSSGKFNHPYRFTHAHNIVQTLAEAHCDIKNNINFIDKKMMPQFKCTLCDKNIFFSEDLEKLAQSFTSHLLSHGHLKNRQAFQVLLEFSESRLNEKELFILKQGNIFCTCCGVEVEANLEMLKSHEIGSEHSKNKVRKQDCPDYAQMVKKSKFENRLNEEKAASHSSNIGTQTLKKKKEIVSIEEKNHVNSKLQALFDNLQNVPLYLKNMNHFKTSEKNSITCLICERVVPPSTYNIETHLLGNNHRKNVEAKNGNEAIQESQGLVVKDSLRSVNGLLLVENICHSSSKHLKDSTPNFDKLHLDEVVYKVPQDEQEREMVQKNCQKHGCSKCNIKLENIPKLLRVAKCRKPKTLPLKLVCKKFDKLVRKSPLLRVNKDSFDNNLDGINTYCKQCKVLIPLTLNEDELEKALLLHLQKKIHLDKLSEFNEKNSDVSKKYFSPNKISRRSSLKSTSNSPKLQHNQSHNKRSSTTQNLPSSALKVSLFCLICLYS